ncbi:NifU family protein [Carboxylicivirga marina]|uniref:NifU family protein n=1 Tax=Carboxylicivirga marina TaxID=2800988 RepID=A0ABS1HJW9_9BACT|nr:NifU family protein [Carboxylicivirga marina]MBK3517931.1 NifU family protein [Carboxylicivirga marina]
MGENKEQIIQQVETALEEIRPYLKGDGGDISLVEVTDDYIVKVRLEGSCDGCPLSMQTLKGGVEMVVKKTVPQIVEVIAVDN